MFPQASVVGNFESLILQDQLNKMMMLQSGVNKGGMAQMAMPRMDVYQRVEDGETVIWCELPGMKKSEVEVNLVNDRLVITGRKPRHNHVCSPDEDDKMVQLVTERTSGAFVREFKVGRGLDEKDVKAEMDHGLLKVVVPSRKEQCHCNIKVN